MPLAVCPFAALIFVHRSINISNSVEKKDVRVKGELNLRTGRQRQLVNAKNNRSEKGGWVEYNLITPRAQW